MIGSRICIAFILGLLFAGCVAEREPAAAEQGVIEQAVAECTAHALCCDAVLPSNAPVVQSLGALLGVSIPPGSTAGVNCSPLDAQCTRAPACCQSNNYNGWLALGCEPL